MRLAWFAIGVVHWLVCLAAAPLAGMGRARAAEPSISAGVAVVDITPPIGYRMEGYFSERPSTGTHDPLQAKAIVLRQGDEQAALVVCDLCAWIGRGDRPGPHAGPTEDRHSRRRTS